jgi:CspA family cold shock protein
MAASRNIDVSINGMITANHALSGEIAEQPSVIELAGQIKWFDVAKGYGFIVPDDGSPDILLHVTCLRRDGYHVALEGARIVVAAMQCERGWQALRILSMDTSTAKHTAPMRPARTRFTVEATGAFERAQVKWFNRLRGFGFLTRGQGTPDIFVHMEILRQFGLSELRPGQSVLVRSPQFWPKSFHRNRNRKSSKRRKKWFTGQGGPCQARDPARHTAADP